MVGRRSGLRFEGRWWGTMEAELIKSRRVGVGDLSRD